MKNKIALTNEQKRLRANPPESLMAVNSQGHLVLDQKAMIASGVMDRQFEAANRLHDLLESKRKTESNK